MDSGLVSMAAVSDIPGYIARVEPPPYIPPTIAPTTLEPVEPPQLTSTPSAGSPTKLPRPILFYIPKSRFIIMSALTFGVFPTLWFYRNWSYLRKREGLVVQPFWRAVFCLFFTHALFRAIRDSTEVENANQKPFAADGWATLWVVAAVIANGASRATSSSNVLALLVISVLPAFFVLPGLDRIEKLNKSDAVQARTDGWSAGQIILLVLSLCVWGLFVVGSLDTK